ncbi:MAG TPA: PAS domain-containing protein [Thermoleophilia bacterium]|nr:PAS domain-containing protein [Thermoleophilia bacterium]
MYFQRGTLDDEHLLLILRALPVDISFADEDDVLRYWSGATYKTCDSRYIGRDVRDCHPQESLETLERILEEFRAGTRDVAEGWSESRQRMKHTRYFAVRDDEGRYRGILEVNQDVTDLRAIEGSQELPGW